MLLGITFSMKKTQKDFEILRENCNPKTNKLSNVRNGTYKKRSCVTG
jgi:hypothetical protein